MAFVVGFAWYASKHREEDDKQQTMMERLEDLKLNAIAEARAGQKRVKVKLDEL